MNRIGYSVLWGVLALLLFIGQPVEAQTQSNCSNFNTPILFNYTIELRNDSTGGNLIDYASCNITTLPGVMNNSLMFNAGGGTYYCAISTDFPTGKYSANITCDAGATQSNKKGNFEVIPDSVPLSIILYLIGISALFIFYIIILDEKHFAIKMLLFLTTFLIYFVIAVLIWSIVTEEGGSASLVNMAQTVFVAYSIIFTLIVFYIIITLIFGFIKALKERKMERMELL